NVEKALEKGLSVNSKGTIRTVFMDEYGRLKRPAPLPDCFKVSVVPRPVAVQTFMRASQWFTVV
ncbi:hypothetical protein, partial [Pseudomonas viridiflava]|uniref:hypothetical protein n=1 Tax=Pseudomonas viridiflava TaxID=33069 RepID=UPI001F2B3191